MQRGDLTSIYNAGFGAAKKCRRQLANQVGKALIGIIHAVRRMRHGMFAARFKKENVIQRHDIVPSAQRQQDFLSDAVTFRLKPLRESMNFRRDLPATNHNLRAFFRFGIRFNSHLRLHDFLPLSPPTLHAHRRSALCRLSADGSHLFCYQYKG